ncbi:SANT and BTB domain regulator of class switch recombination-like [Diadema antillarum]|uniref:SANT and BTB domain regulator of class switch recombination-like n=1 Tax=Diadema antillarum TaxID=105358 RepID=UPI003A8B6969
MTRREDPSRAVALDLMLRTFMNSSEFNDMQPKNWDAIAKLIPGTMPQECAQRFEELQSAAGDLSHVGNFSSLAAQGKPVPRGKNAETSSRRNNKAGPRPSSGLQHDRARGKKSGVQQDREGIPAYLTQGESSAQKDAKSSQMSNKDATANQRVKAEGPNIVIHVCDEAKNVKRDFNCPRDLLVREMKYFAEYLSLEAQRWEEVDISVHCDVQIFEWLMRYVHRHIPERQASVPKLEASNVISILISSDFLKMDALVTECVQFCHKHMSAIVSTPCNMNCINDKLVTRIASLFTDVEADDVKDKKDKFKSKLFIKKIEQLFDPSNVSATMYKCQHCKRLLTRESQSLLKCLPSRLSIDRTGRLVYHHQRMTSWDVNDYLISLHTELKAWRDVYWRLWGQVNVLKCSRCKQVFQCSELGQCRLHPKTPVFVKSVDQGSLKATVVGSYPCCDQPAYRFDPLEQSTGCESKDHVVTFSGLDKSDPSRHSQETRILETLLERRDVICAPSLQPISEKWSDANIFSTDEALSGVIDEGLGVKGQLHNIFPDDTMPFAKHIDVQPEPMASSTDDWDSSDDEVGDDEEQVKGRGRRQPIRRKQSSKSIVGRDKQASAKSNSNVQIHRKKWDATRSLRFNQDTQREEDQLRSNFLVQHLIKMRISSGEKLEKTKVKEFAGGMFSKVDAQFRASMQVTKPVGLQPLSRTKSRNIQNKMS